MQERVDDAYKWIAKCEKLEKSNQTEGKEGSLRYYEVQYDYLKAYFDMYNGYPKFEIVRELCDKHIGHTVVSWRNKFVDMANQLAEFDGELKELQNQAGAGGKADETKGTDGKPLETKKIFESKMQEDGLIFDVRGVSSVKLEFFYIDLEILFSRNPFIKSSFDEFVYVQPNSVMDVPFGDENSKQMQYSVKIPENVKNKNMVIKVTDNHGQFKTHIHYSSSFNLNIDEAEGMAKLSSKDGIPMPKIYVKCFAKLPNGTVVFFKDGYTDLRGTFNYLDVNETDATKFLSFSILVVSEDKGSKIHEFLAPKTTGAVVNRELLVKSKGWAVKQDMAMNRFNKYAGPTKKKNK